MGRRAAQRESLSCDVVLRVRSVTRSYGSRRVLGPVSFEAAPGRVVGIAGANGSGKTTLLKIVAGLIRPTSGTVDLDGVLTRDVPLSLGWVAPDLALYGELTPPENLVFFGRVAGRAFRTGDVDARLEDVGLDPVRMRDTETRALSTGQRQRLKMAYAVLLDPGLLLLDEPGSNLDEAGRAIVMKVVAAQRRRGTAVIASNDPRDLALADETVALA